MEKYIVRTIRNKVAVYARFEEQDGKLVEVERRYIDIPDRYGDRIRKKIEAEQELQGWTLSSIQTREKKMAISITDFLAHAVEVY